MVKKINEENLVLVNKKVKKCPAKPKKLWDLGLTKARLIKLINEFPDDIPIIAPGMDHTYEHLSIQASTALFDCKNNIINEDFGEGLTPEDKYGVRKNVIILK